MAEFLLNLQTQLHSFIEILLKSIVYEVSEVFQNKMCESEDEFQIKLHSISQILVRRAVFKITQCVEDSFGSEMALLKKENESLKWRLQLWEKESGAGGDLGQTDHAGHTLPREVAAEIKETDTKRKLSGSEASDLPDAWEGAPLEQQDSEEEWGSILTELTAAKGKEKLGEQHTESRQSVEDLDSVHMLKTEPESETPELLVSDDFTEKINLVSNKITESCDKMESVSVQELKAEPNDINLTEQNMKLQLVYTEEQQTGEENITEQHTEKSQYRGEQQRQLQGLIISRPCSVKVKRLSSQRWFKQLNNPLVSKKFTEKIDNLDSVNIAENCNELTSAFAQEIKEEVNEFKVTEQNMELQLIDHAEKENDESGEDNSTWLQHTKKGKAQKGQKRKMFSVPEVIEGISQGDSGAESDDGLSGLESADSFSEDVFNDGLDPLLDFEDIEELPIPSTSQCTQSTDSPQTKRGCLIPTLPPQPARTIPPTASEPEGRWKTEKEEDVEPVQFRFCPERIPGAQLDTSKKYSPLDLFQLFFSVNVVQSLCTNTNKNAKKRRAQGIKYEWNPVSIKDMYQFMGILIFMGLLTSHNMRDYWSRQVPYNVPFCRSIMTRKRFEAISWTLHISDPEEDRENDKKKGTPKYDPLSRLRPLLDSLLLACQSFYQPRQNLAVDERMVASKSRIGFRQYMKRKPTKWGFKLFVLADASTGYTCDFTIYTGKSQSASGKGLSYDSVMNLLKVSYLGMGYHVYVDSFYSGSALFRDLYRLKFGACGTIRENHPGFPSTKENTLPKKAETGCLRWIRCDELLFTKWMDTHEVTMCSTIHKAHIGDTVQRKVRRPDGTWHMQAVPVPAPVKAYNQHMAGVDLSDALIKNYNLAHKTRKWYKKVFFHFIDIAVVNSFLLHKEMAGLQSSQALTHKAFREQLCRQLASLGAEEQQGGTASPTEMCLPSAITEGLVLDPSRKASTGRRVCALCMEKKQKVKTPWRCEKCNISLCLIVDRNCFKEWHLRMKK
ncbi:piggyBac transposable element-derived protein 4-like isoform X1 [Lepisosteus oculatus]|uniref:piggyBac transposable element-derived protein 4-like isoform X1 n=1 Tax=Lepisosteus oculatus TaxID=7918 RepID=UPI003722E429